MYKPSAELTNVATLAALGTWVQTRGCAVYWPRGGGGEGGEGHIQHLLIELYYKVS